MRLLLALAVLALPRPAVPVVIAPVVHYIPGSAPLAVVVERGSGLVVVNADVPGEQAEHDLAEDAPAPRFFSPHLLPGESAEVSGVDALPPGVYDFHCTVHPVLMTGTLEVR